MKNNYIKLFALVVLSACLGACKKELNVFPTTTEVDGNVITDQNSARVVLNGVYYRFADAGFDRNKVPSIKWTDLNEDFASELSGGLVNSGATTKFILLNLQLLIILTRPTVFGTMATVS